MTEQQKKGGYGLRSLGPAQESVEEDGESIKVTSQCGRASSTGAALSRTGTSKAKTVRSGYGSQASKMSMSSAARKKEEEIKAMEVLGSLEEEEEKLKSEVQGKEALIKDFQEELTELHQKLAEISPDQQEEAQSVKNDIDYISRQMKQTKRELNQLKANYPGRVKVIESKKRLILQKKELAQQVIDEESEGSLDGLDLSDGHESIPDRTQKYVEMTVEEAAKHEKAKKVAGEIDAEKIVERDREKARLLSQHLKIEQQKRQDEELANALGELEGIKLEKENNARKVSEGEKKESELLEKVKSLSSAKVVVPIVDNTTTEEVTGIKQLVSAMTKAYAGNSSSQNSRFLARQSTAKELPYFSGRAEEWTAFKADFYRSTADCGFSNSENLGRLRKSLTGLAAKYVQSLMVSVDNVPKVMHKLETRFGQPETIIKSMIERVRAVPKFKEEELEKFIDFGGAVQNVVATIMTLNLHTHLSNPQLLQELQDKLPRQMLMQWLRWVDDDSERKSDLVHFETWLEKQTTIACKACPPSFPSEEKPDVYAAQKSKKRTAVSWMANEDDLPTAAGLLTGQQGSCIFCGKHSNSAECYTADKMSYSEKEKIINSKGPCYRCFNMNHIKTRCPVRLRCRHCGEEHASCMCMTLSSNQYSSNNGNAGGEKYRSDKRGTATKSKTSSTEAIPTTTTQLASSSQVLLKTLMIEVEGRYGTKKVRAVIDDGAQGSYILKSLAEDLGLSPVGQEEMRHVVFGGEISGAIRHKRYEVKVRNAFKNGTSIITVLDKERICRDLPRICPGSWMKELKGKGIWLSDIGVGSPEIQILIGADVLTDIISETAPHKLKNGLVALKTDLGWAVMGKLHGEEKQSSSTAMIVTELFHAECSVDQLWSLESIGIRDPVEVESQQEREQKIKMDFLESVERNKEGRFCISLPWIAGRPKIPSNKFEARQRLESTTHSLMKNGKFELYGKLFEDWEKEGIIEEVKDGENEGNVHYLPHHAVIKPQSTTTPIRPVFDASNKTGRNPSLNECLEKGPNLLELIPSILYRFREKKVGVISDIRKAFQMIEVRKEDRDYLRFLWWEDYGEKKLKVYRHKRVVFGVNASPFILAALLEHVLTKYIPRGEEHIAQQLLKSLYVDNCVTSVETLEEAEEFQDWATNVLAAAKLDLRQWEGGFTDESGVGPLASKGCGLDFGRERIEGLGKPVTSVLGYKWDKIKDTICCDLSVLNLPGAITKKVVLSEIQKVYDPIGFTCPAMLQPKLLMQRLWENKLKWKDPIPDDDKKEFEEWCEEMQALGDIEIPRNASSGQSDRGNWQLHVFCDASNLAYAAVVFLRVEIDGEVRVQQVAAKARVAPLQKTTINRLELLGCFIAAILCESVKKALSIEGVPTTYWSDSTTALAWISTNDEWGTFVGNRVKTICKLSDPSEWRYVPGKMNPADLPSRGCTPAELLASKWWEGPDWLKSPGEDWPRGQLTPDKDAVKAEKKKGKTMAMLEVGRISPWYEVHTKFSKNVTRVAWFKRYINYLKGKNCPDKVTGPLTVEEREEAEMIIIGLVQQEALPQNTVVIDGIHVGIKGGLLRVKTRLTERREYGEGEEAEGLTYPIMLPHEHPITNQIIREAHIKHKHAGIQFLMSFLREKYWILRGRKAIRKMVKACVVCRRFSEKSMSVVPAALPADRVTTGKTFDVIGVDLAGPLFVKEGGKAWFVLFTCAVYRCVHLEVVQSLSTEAFLDAFARFTARRGRPSTVYSDNGTNFVGAENAMKELDWELIEKKLGMEKIRWKFNPPASPWWGGFWERLIRSIKDLLKRSIGRAKLSLNKLATILCEIEGVINGRPLTTVTEDPEDLIPLTPAMFLHDTRYPGITDRELLEASGFRKLFENKNRVMDQLRSRFRKEYLALLVHRGKQRKVAEFKVGDVVLIGSDNKKRWQWPMGRIVELIPGRDKNVRVARVKTAVGVVTRPLQWIFAMEISAPDEVPASPDTTDADVSVVQGCEDGHEIPDTTDADVSVVENCEDGPINVVTRFGRKVKTPDRFKP